MSLWIDICKFQGKRWAKRANARGHGSPPWAASEAWCFADGRRRLDRLYQLMVHFWDEEYWKL